MNEKHVLSIIETFNNSNIAEIEITEGNFRMVLRRDAAFGRSAQGGHGEAAGVAREAPQGDAQNAQNAHHGGQVHLGMPASPSGNETVDSPIVGTFYAAPGPDAPPFVKPGSKVKAGESLCILEAMKMMNHLEAEFDCEIVSVLASNGDLVEYGQALFEIKRAQG